MAQGSGTKIAIIQFQHQLGISMSHLRALAGHHVVAGGPATEIGNVRENVPNSIKIGTEDHAAYVE